MQAAHWTCSEKTKYRLGQLAHVDFFFSFLSPFDRVCFWGTFFFSHRFSAAPPNRLPHTPTYLLLNCLPTLVAPTYLLSLSATYLPARPPSYLPTPILPTCQQSRYLPSPTYQVTNPSISSSIITTLQLFENDDRMDDMRLLQKNQCQDSGLVFITKVHT